MPRTDPPRPASPASTVSFEDSPKKDSDKKFDEEDCDKNVPQMDEAERNLAIKMKLISEMSERVEQRPPRITRSTILPEFDQIPDESGELRYKGDQWAAKATYLLTSLFLHEAALEACAIESRYELAKSSGLVELEGIFAKIKAYQLPSIKPKPTEDPKESPSTSTSEAK